jgi:hypothetical protein
MLPITCQESQLECYHELHYYLHYQCIINYRFRQVGVSCCTRRQPALIHSPSWVPLAARRHGSVVAIPLACRHHLDIVVGWIGPGHTWGGNGHVGLGIRRHGRNLTRELTFLQWWFRFADLGIVASLVLHASFRNVGVKANTIDVSELVHGTGLEVDHGVAVTTFLLLCIPHGHLYQVRFPLQRRQVMYGIRRRLEHFTLCRIDQGDASSVSGMKTFGMKAAQEQRDHDIGVWVCRQDEVAKSRCGEELVHGFLLLLLENVVLDGFK